jgi:hypothetical protein
MTGINMQINGIPTAFQEIRLRDPLGTRRKSPKDLNQQEDTKAVQK